MSEIMLSKIREFVDEFREELFFVLVIVLVALIGFGLGRLSVTGQGSAGALRLISTPVGVEQFVGAIESEAPAAEEGSVAESTDVVGNKNSRVFHLSHCSGARRMSESNKVYFASVQAALDAGYRAAVNCPGL